MKYTISLLLLLLPFFAHAQREVYIGYYVQLSETSEDTIRHILLSIDSVREIQTRQGHDDLWMSTKTGTWRINEYDSTNDKSCITFLFNDSSTDEMCLIPLYETFPPPKWMKPIRYQAAIGQHTLQKVRGKDGFMQSIKTNINNRKS